jgi:hypothetical protein
VWTKCFLTVRMKLFFYHGATAPSKPRPPVCQGFTITLIHTTLDRTPLDEWSDRHREIYVTANKTHQRQISMPSGGIRTHNPSKQAAADRSFRPRGHWYRQNDTKYSWKIALGWYMLLMEKCFYYPNYAAHKLTAKNINKMSGTNICIKVLYSDNSVDLFKD